jgi:hypothetical protein
MLILDKWNLTGTLTLLTHPERSRTAVKDPQSAMHRSEEERRYAEAYKKILDEVSDEDFIIYSFRNNKS